MRSGMNWPRPVTYSISSCTSSGSNQSDQSYRNARSSRTTLDKVSNHHCFSRNARSGLSRSRAGCGRSNGIYRRHSYTAFGRRSRRDCRKSRSNRPWKVHGFGSTPYR